MMSSRTTCCCGNHINKDGHSTSSTRPNESENQMDASFVHLPSPLPSPPLNSSSKQLNDSILFNHGLLRTHQYISTLLIATEECLDSHNKDADNRDTKELDACFCQDCIRRMNDAICENTDQLEMETKAYIQAVEEQQDKQRRIEKALLINAGIHNDNLTKIELGKDEIMRSTIQSFKQEINNLESVGQEYENELMNQNQLLVEQAQISETLAVQQDELLVEYNTLELEAKVFEGVHSQLTQKCHSAELESSRLSSIRLHSTLFNIVVDDKGVLYPLINNLRLSHRPMGDLQWVEINSAWSQATQLLMFMSNAVSFISRNFGIVPLMHCAKIIEMDSFGEKEYHNLGVDFHSIDKKTHNTEQITSAILLQLYTHLKTIEEQIDWARVPYEMSMHKIGNYDLQLIQAFDDDSWKGIINCIASNLRWLSSIL